MFKSIFARSPSSINSDSFIKRELDVASLNAEKNRSIRSKINKPQFEQTQSVRFNQNSSLRLTALSPLHKEMVLDDVPDSSENVVSVSSQEQRKYSDVSEQEIECCRQSDAAKCSSLSPFEDLLDNWTNVIKVIIFPEQEEIKQGVMYETRLHDGHWLVLL